MSLGNPEIKITFAINLPCPHHTVQEWNPCALPTALYPMNFNPQGTFSAHLQLCLDILQENLKNLPYNASITDREPESWRAVWARAAPNAQGSN